MHRGVRSCAVHDRKHYVPRHSARFRIYRFVRTHQSLAQDRFVAGVLHPMVLRRHELPHAESLLVQHLGEFAHAQSGEQRTKHIQAQGSSHVTLLCTCNGFGIFDGKRRG